MLVDLIKARVSYVVQEAVVVIKDIFRRYPNKCDRSWCEHVWHGCVVQALLSLSCTVCCKPSCALT